MAYGQGDTIRDLEAEIEQLVRHKEYIERKKNKEIEKLKKLYYEKVAEVKAISEERNELRDYLEDLIYKSRQ